MGTFSRLVPGLDEALNTVTSDAAGAAADAAAASSAAADAYALAGTKSIVSAESEAKDSHALTTLADQVVFVIAKGCLEFSAGDEPTLQLLYDGGEVDVLHPKSRSSDVFLPFCLTWVGTPGNATASVSIATDIGRTHDEVISVIKIL